MQTNRFKAVLFVNMSYFAMFFYNVFLKVAVNEKGIYPFDLCLVRTILMLIFCTVLMFASRQSFHIEKSDRCPLFLRCVLDLTAYIGIVFGLPLVPLIVMSTIFQTAPFWASILGYFVIGETISCFEIIAMFASFGGIICICISSRQHADDGKEVAIEGDATGEGDVAVASIEGS